MSWAHLLGLIGSAVGVVGGLKKAKAEAKANDREAQLVRDEAGLMRQEAELSRESNAFPLYAEAEAARYNAALADQDADAIDQQYAELARRQRVAGNRALYSMHAQAAAGGFTLEGSAQDLITSSAIDAELDVLTVQHEGLLRARASRQEAEIARTRGRNALAQAGLVERAADQQGARAGLVEGRAAGIAARSKDIKKLGMYTAVSEGLKSAGSPAGMDMFKQVGSSKKRSAKYDRGWFTARKGKG